MIKTSDIKDAIIAKLKAKYPTYPVVCRQVSGQLPAAPFFAIHFVSSQTIPDGFAWQRRTKRVDVMYFPAKEIDTKEGDAFAVADVLENNVFKNGIAVQDRFFTFLNTDIEIVDFVLHYSFQFEFSNIFDDIIDPLQQMPLMENLEMKLTVETTEGDGIFDIVEKTEED